MKKKLIMIFVFLILVIVPFVCYKEYYSKTEWDYEGQAVILIANPDYEFVGTTNMKLKGEIYGFGKYYLGDLYFDRLEELSTYPGNDKVSTMYRYNLDKKGEEYFESKEIRKAFSNQIMDAVYLGKKMEKTKMMSFFWYEWGIYPTGKLKRKEVATSFFYIKENGEMPCVLYFVPRWGTGEIVTCYFIVPGVSTREEAISLMKENFEQLGMGNFIYY